MRGACTAVSVIVLCRIKTSPASHRSIRSSAAASAVLLRRVVVVAAADIPILDADELYSAVFF